MTDWTPGEGWEQMEVPEGADPPIGSIVHYGTKERTVWRKKPTPEPYTPSPEAKDLLRRFENARRTRSNPSGELRIIDAALDAARQQGRDEGARTGAERYFADRLAGPDYRQNYNEAREAIKNSQGAGPAIPPEPSTSGSGGDGSTVASPLRGPKDPPLLEADVLDAHEWAALFVEQFPTLDPGSDYDLADVSVWFANAIQVGRDAGYADGLGAIPEGKVLVDRKLVERAIKAIAPTTPATVALELRAALEGEGT